MTDVFFQQYLRQYTPFKDYWNYEDGCVMTGCQRMFEATGQRIYADFVLSYLSPRVEESGRIPLFPVSRCSMDSFNLSKALFFAYDLTGEPRYRKAVFWSANQLHAHPQTDSGMYWHKKIYPHQVWIDGMYMAAPFLTELAARTDDAALIREVTAWFRFVRLHMRDPETGLYSHAYDESRTQLWADAETGLSQSHWLRGEGWFLMALTDTYALMPEKYAQERAFLADILRDAVTALMPYRTESGLLCQVIDRPDLPGNYTETSGNLMTACALMRGAQLHMLGADAAETGLSMLETVETEKLIQLADGAFSLTGICAAAGLGGAQQRDGSAAYYLSEPVVSDDPKGVGALMMACSAGNRYRGAEPARALSRSGLSVNAGVRPRM